MALFTDESLQHLEKTEYSLLGNPEWSFSYSIGDKVPASGIYRCEGCGDEITSNKGDPFPPQNKHQHANGTNVKWRLIVQTQTKG